MDPVVEVFAYLESYDTICVSKNHKSAIFPQTGLSVGVLAVLYQSSWYLLELATRGPPRPAAEPAAGKCPALAARIPQTGPRVNLDQKMMKKNIKVLRMEFSIVEKLSGPQESIFSLVVLRGPQLNTRKQI